MEHIAVEFSLGRLLDDVEDAADHAPEHLLKTFDRPERHEDVDLNRPIYGAPLLR